MLNRLHRIFLRYADRNLRVDGPRDVPLEDSHGRFGCVSRLALDENRLLIEGLADADRIGVRLERAEYWTRPQERAGSTPERSFVLDVPFEVGDPMLLAERLGDTAQVHLPGFTARRVARARAALALPFLATLVGLLPEIYRWKWQGDMGAREVVKQRLKIVPGTDAADMSGTVLGLGAPPAPPSGALPDAADIVLPVHNAFDLLPEVLDRVARNSDLEWRLVVADDASTDPRVWPFLRDWAAAPDRKERVTLLRNDENLGFVGTVNRCLAALEASDDRPVVLLNSDALVPPRWLSRLTAPLADPAVASATPMSNDAEIFSVPVIGASRPLAPGAAEAIDCAAAALAPGTGQVEAPTGVGFCMALARPFLARVPQFDPAFGRGYGEENDWCQKTRALGGRHVCVPRLFVEHRGGTSFGNAAKQRLLERNLAEIARRYPGYHDEVQAFVRDDPLNTARLALGFAWACAHQDAPVPVYLGHSLGGGAENDLKARIAADLGQQRSAVVLRVGQRRRWLVELHTPSGRTEGLTDDTELVRRLIRRLPDRRIVYSCGVGDRDATELPELLVDLVAGDLEVLMHDYFPISPSYTLLARDGRYHGVPLPGTHSSADPAHGYRRPNGQQIGLAAWQSAWRRLFRRADRVTVFSQSSGCIVATAFPETAPRLSVVPHRSSAAVPRISPGGAPVIGVLGNIGLQKGAAVLQGLSRHLSRHGNLRLAVVGNIAPEWPLSPPSVVHGTYRLEDLPGLVARYGISAWLIPSIWPETYSFATREALATGLPVMAFDLGAQGDAVSEAPNGIALPLELAEDPTALARHLELLLSQVQEAMNESPDGAKTG